MKRNNKKGFTLAELLIVVAIIAVLVAVAIPVFTTQLDKAKLATATGNARSITAEYIANCLSPVSGEPVAPTSASLETSLDATDALGVASATADVTAGAVTVKYKDLTASFSIDSDIK